MDAIAAFDAALSQRIDADDIPGVVAILFDAGGNRYEAAHGADGGGHDFLVCIDDQGDRQGCGVAIGGAESDSAR
jgi:hypothetical protein